MRFTCKLRFLLIITFVLGIQLLANAQYQLVDNDVVMENGYIKSLTTQGATNVQGQFITIPSVMQSQTVVGISDADEGIFAEKEITGVSLPISIEYIGNNAFHNNKISNVDLSNCNKLKIIAELAFFINPFTSINFTNCVSLEEIGNHAFSPMTSCWIGAYSTYPTKTDGYHSLTSIDLSPCSALKIIGQKAFFGNSLTSVNLSGCKALEVITASSFSYNQLSSVDLSGCTALKKICGYAFFKNASNPSFILPEPQFPGYLYWEDENANTYNHGETITLLTSDFYAVKEYTLTNGEIIIDANGIIQSCSYSSSIDDAINLIIPNTINGIEVKGIADKEESEGVFSNKNIRSVVFPATIEKIGNYAFYGNIISKLDLTDLSSLKLIGSYSFNKNRLRKVYFTNCSALEVISNNCFGGVYNITNKISIPLDFSTCTALKTIGNETFRGNSISSINFNNCVSLERIEDGAFRANSIRTIDISSSTALKYLGRAFVENSISSTTLPATSYTNLWHWSNTLSDLYQPEDVIPTDFSCTAIFYYILKDEDVEVDENGMITHCYLKNFNEYCNGILYIPDTLDNKIIKGIANKEDGSGVFSNKGITQLLLPNTVEHIGDHAFSNNAISGVNLNQCNRLKYLGNSSFKNNSINDSINFGGFIDLKIIGNSCFESNKIKTVDLSDCSSLEQISGKAFYNNGLINFSIENCISLHTIRQEAISMNANINQMIFNFSTCTMLHTVEKNALSSLESNSTHIILPDSKYNGFTNWACTNTNTYNPGDKVSFWRNSYGFKAQVPYTLQNTDVTIDTNGIIQSCNYSGFGTIITIPEILNGINVKGISDKVFSNIPVTTLVLPKSIETIGSDAFSDNWLVDIDFSKCSNLEIIETGAFEYNCLSSLDLSPCKRLKFIGYYCFNTNYIQPNFILPTPEYIGFEGWIDGDSNAVSVGVVISECKTKYQALIPYQLQSGDVEIDENGIITKCNVADFNAPKYANGKICIPNTIGGVAVKGILEKDEPNQGIFSDKGLNTLILSDSIHAIGNYAFYNNNISELYISTTAQIEEIGKGAFAKNALSAVDISSLSTLRLLSENAFAENLLNSITLPIPDNNNSLNWMDSKGGLLNNNAVVSDLSLWFKAQVPYVLKGADATINEHGTITQCTLDKYVYYLLIPEKIGSVTIKGIGSRTFASKGLTAVELPNTIESIGSEAFKNNSLFNIDISSMSKLNLVGNKAFYDNSVTSIKLPVSQLDGFMNWVDKNGLTYSGTDIVSDFENFYKAQIPYTLQDGDVEIDKNGMILSYSYSGNGTYITIPETLKGITVKGIIDAESYSTKGVFQDREFTYVKLPATIEYIGLNAFMDNEYLVDINLNQCPMLTTIGDGSFYRTCLNTLDFSNCQQLKLIDNYAFYNCNITSINFGDSSNLEFIGVKAFFINRLSKIDISKCTSLDFIGSLCFVGNNIHEFELPVNKSPAFRNWEGTNTRPGVDTIYCEGGDTIANLTCQYQATYYSQYTVTFKDWDGTELKVETVEEDSSATAPANPIRTGYTFTGWDVDFSKPTANLTVTARYILINGIDNNTNVEVNIYPNPATSNVTINGAEGEDIKIYTVQGILVKEVQTIEDNQTISVTELSQGIYLVKVGDMVSRLSVVR